jgi:DNA-binding NarL/FixJ family response regulator
MSAVEHGELTDLERQVARLVAWGGSSHDVAEALEIDAKAVERHLAHVYRKLAIRSGAELPCLEEPSPDTVGEASRGAALDRKRIVERSEQ